MTPRTAEDKSMSYGSFRGLITILCVAVAGAIAFHPSAAQNTPTVHDNRGSMNIVIKDSLDRPTKDENALPLQLLLRSDGALGDADSVQDTDIETLRILYADQRKANKTNAVHVELEVFLKDGANQLSAERLRDILGRLISAAGPENPITVTLYLPQLRKRH
jgi:hypothetical protein